MSAIYLPIKIVLFFIFGSENEVVA